MSAQIFEISDAETKAFGNAEGKSAVAYGVGMDDQSVDMEVYQAPGVFALPADGVKVVRVPIAGTNRYGIGIAVNNYRIEIDVGGKGGAALYSTTGDGQTVKAKIVLDPSGNAEITTDGKVTIDGTAIELNGDSKQFVTWSELNTELTTLAATLTAHVHPETGATTGPSPGLVGLTIDISGAKTSTIKTGG